MANGLTFPQFNPIPQQGQLNVPGIIQAAQQTQLQQQQLNAGDILAQRAAQINPLVPIALGGGQDAQAAANQIFQLNPEVGKDIFAQQRAQAEEQRAAQAQQIEAEQLEAAEGLRIVRAIMDSSNPQLFASTVFANEVAAFEDESGLTIADLSPEDFDLTMEVIEASLFAKTAPGEFEPRGGEEPGKIVQYQDQTTGKTFNVQEGSQEELDLAATPGIDKVGITQRIITGTRAEVDLTSQTTGTLQTDILQLDEQISLLKAIRTNFDERFLQLPARLGAAFTSAMEILNLGDPTDEQKEFVRDLAVFQADAIRNINKAIKFFTGAQMSEKEAVRIRLPEPDPGEGIIPKDSETKFLAKLNNVIRQVTLARARRVILLQRGINTDGLFNTKEARDAFFDFEFTLDDAESAISAREDELSQQGLTDDQILEILGKEFGL